MIIMGIMGALMYLTAPQIISVMTPVADIRTLAVEVLRIEAFAEPMFAAAIVAYGVFIGAGSTLAPSLMNFGSIWGIRLPLAFLLAPPWGCAACGWPCASSCASAGRYSSSACGAASGSRRLSYELRATSSGERERGSSGHIRMALVARSL